MSAGITKIDPTKEEWYPRLPRDPEATRRMWKSILGVIAAIVAFAVIYTILREISRFLALILHVFALVGSCLYTTRKVNAADAALPVIARISKLDHDPDQDRPVAVRYHIDGVLIGEDTGWFGRRKEGVIFSGLQTTFLLAPENVQVEPGRHGAEDTRRMLHLNFPLGDAAYRISIFPLGELTTEKVLDAASLLYAIMADDGTTAPSTNITNPPPRSPSPTQRHIADFEYKFFWACATLIPILCALALWWWVSNTPAKDTTVFTGLILAIPALFGLVLIALTDIHPNLASRRKKIFELQARSQRREQLDA